MSDEILKLIKDKEVQYVDLRFNDLRGKMQHVTFDVSMIDKDIQRRHDVRRLVHCGWKAINESDMVMRPDSSSAHIDPILPGDDARPSSATFSSRARCSLTIAIRAESRKKPKLM